MSEPIYTVDLFHDCPIEGIANFEGDPHHFKCEFDDDADEYSGVYCLTPISAATLQLAMEKWQIWLRWEASFRAGEALVDTHPALLNERARYNEIQEAVGQAIEDARTRALQARARFLPDATVEWTRVTS